VTRAYGSIPHLPGSRTGPSDKHAGEALLRRCTVDAKGAKVTVQEKLDGSCVAVLRDAHGVRAVGREGRLASASPNPGRRMFARWVAANQARFVALLAVGERAIGEWLALVHATPYALPHEPFVLFDLIRDGARAPAGVVEARGAAHGFVAPYVVHRGGALAVDVALARLGMGGHGARVVPEGVVYRVEGKGIQVAKFVRADKVDGSLLPENTGQPAQWNYTDGARDLHHVEPE
jgi:hypothetical protein